MDVRATYGILNTLLSRVCKDPETADVLKTFSDRWSLSMQVSDGPGATRKVSFVGHPGDCEVHLDTLAVIFTDHTTSMCKAVPYDAIVTVDMYWGEQVVKRRTGP